MNDYLTSVHKRFKSYKELGQKTFDQLNDEGLFWQYNAESNSIAIIVQHLAGNMISRWTDLLTSDGEKPWRHRDEEFETVLSDKRELLDRWNEGWKCLFETFETLKEDDLQKTIYIRSEPHTVIDSINRQLAHCAYHIGQVVFIGKMVAGSGWESLSIPKGGSETFNEQTFTGRKTSI